MSAKVDPQIQASRNLKGVTIENTPFDSVSLTSQKMNDCKGCDHVSNNSNDEVNYGNFVQEDREGKQVQFG
jgi:hypothetical protein